MPTQLKARKTPRRPTKAKTPIVAFYSVYNDMELLPKSVESIEPYVDQMIFLDGIYARFPGTTPISTDNLRSFAYSFGPKGKYYIASGYEQHEKRNLAFRLAPPGSWILVIDGDEVLHGARHLRQAIRGLTEDIGSILFSENGNYYTRIFRARPGVGYVNHSHIGHDGRITSICNCLGERLPEQIYFHNLKEERSTDRKAQKAIYYEGKSRTEVEMIQRLRLG